MDPRILVAMLAVVTAVAVIVAVLFAMRQRKSRYSEEHFSAEYAQMVRQHGDPQRAEEILIEREKRVEKFSIHPLSASDRQRYSDEWWAMQRLFVDDPSFAVNQADKLVATVMAARGYPMGNFAQRAADISLTYPAVVHDYRAAQEILLRRAKSTTEDLRQAMLYFRSLFDELVDLPHRQVPGVSYERAS